MAKIFNLEADNVIDVSKLDKEEVEFLLEVCMGTFDMFDDETKTTINEILDKCTVRKFVRSHLEKMN